jgi:hypothetical protein
MKRFTETLYNIKDAIEIFWEGLKDDINSIKISLKWKIILCSLFVFGIVSYIYPPIFIFTIALLCWLMIVSVPIIIIGGVVIFGGFYVIYNLIESRYPYLGALLSVIISIVFIGLGIYAIWNWILIEAFSVLGQIIIDIF